MLQIKRKYINSFLKNLYKKNLLIKLFKFLKIVFCVVVKIANSMIMWLCRMECTCPKLLAS